METPNTPTTPPITENDSTAVVALADLAAAKGLPAFCVVLEGSGLYPRAYAGSLLVCSTGIEPLPADIVLAEVPPGGPVRALVLNGDGDLTANRCYVPFDSGRGYALVATVTEILPPTAALETTEAHL